SYPDLVEQNGKFWVTETQKTTAKVHEVDRTLFDGLWAQRTAKEAATRGLVADVRQADLAKGVDLKGAGDVEKKGGLTLDLWLKWDDLEPGAVILDGRARDGKGMV